MFTTRSGVLCRSNSFARVASVSPETYQRTVRKPARRMKRGRRASAEPIEGRVATGHGNASSQCTLVARPAVRDRVSTVYLDSGHCSVDPFRQITFNRGNFNYATAPWRSCCATDHPAGIKVTAILLLRCGQLWTNIIFLADVLLPGVGPGILRLSVSADSPMPAIRE